MRRSHRKGLVILFSALVIFIITIGVFFTIYNRNNTSNVNEIDKVSDVKDDIKVENIVYKNEETVISKIDPMKESEVGTALDGESDEAAEKPDSIENESVDNILNSSPKTSEKPAPMTNLEITSVLK